MRRLLLLPALILIATAGCSTNEDITPTNPSPGNTIPTIAGTYSSPTMWLFELRSATTTDAFTCAGSLTIANQVGDNFSGSFLILDNNCGNPFRGAVVNGVFSSAGAIAFELTFADPPINFVTGLFQGCTYVSGATGMNGTLNGTRLESEARTELDCPDGRVSQLIRIAGSR